MDKLVIILYWKYDLIHSMVSSYLTLFPKVETSKNGPFDWEVLQTLHKASQTQSLLDEKIRWNALLFLHGTKSFGLWSRTGIASSLLQKRRLDANQMLVRRQKHNLSTMEKNKIEILKKIVCYLRFYMPIVVFNSFEFRKPEDPGASVLNLLWSKRTYIHQEHHFIQ